MGTFIAIHETFSNEIHQKSLVNKSQEYHQKDLANTCMRHVFTSIKAMKEIVNHNAPSSHACIQGGDNLLN